MKKTLIYTLIVLISTVIISVIPTEAECAVYEDTVRLHILANSDSEEDQELKLELRNAILIEFSEKLSVYENAEEAKECIDALLPEIEKFAKEKIAEFGYDYSIKAYFETEWYDTREYESFTLPMGYYSSLKIVIGNGDGKNWWCVMFPPLCLDVATENASADDAVKKYTDSEFTLISGKGYKAKFKILELMSSVFS